MTLYLFLHSCSSTHAIIYVCTCVYTRWPSVFVVADRFFLLKIIEIRFLQIRTELKGHKCYDRTRNLISLNTN